MSDPSPQPPSLAEQWFALSELPHQVLSPDGLVLEANTATLTLLGRSRDEVIDRPGIDHVHPDDRAEAVDALHAALASDGSVRTLLRVGSNAEGWRTVEIWGHFESDVGLVLSTWTPVDHSEPDRHDASASLRPHLATAMSQNADALLVALEITGNRRHFSRSWRALGYSADELRQTKILDIVHPDDQHDVATLLIELVNNERNDVEWTCRMADSAGAWHEIRWTAWHSDNAQLLLIRGTPV